jgi:HEPN domain-containing protein
MTRTRNLAKHYYTNYLIKAKEFRNAMTAAFERKDWNACAGNAVHCAISAVDAFCVFKTEKRSAGERHEDTLSLLIGVDTQDKTLQQKAKHLSSLLGLKTKAEYGEQLISESQAITAQKHAHRLLEYVETRIAKEITGKSTMH